MTLASTLRVFAAILLLMGLPAYGDSDDVGRPLIEVLEELRADGLRLVWGSNVVRADMIVESAEDGDSPRATLELLLEPHGLAVQEAEAGILVVIRAPDGILAGEVRGGKTGKPIAGVEIEVRGFGTTRSDPDGLFEVTDLAAGSYEVEARKAGYAIERRRVTVEAGARAELTLQLQPVDKTLEEMTVIPSRVSLLQAEPAPEVLWTRDEVNRLPHLSDDLFRAVSRLPGVAAGDFSADFHVRGGERTELLVLIDGLRVYDPYHLKDFQNVFSIFDSNATGSVEMTSGGFTADYGDRMSGVIEIASVVPVERRTMLGVSFEKLHFLSQGRFDGGDSEWLLSARRGYLDLLLDTVTTEDNDFDISPAYYDLFSKVQRRIGRSGLLSFNLLVAADDIEFRSDNDDDELQSSWTDAYGWLKLDNSWGRLSQTSVLSYGHLERDRDGRSGSNHSDPFLPGPPSNDRTTVRDQRTTGVAHLRHDWRFNLSDRQHLRSGIEVRRLESDYDYNFLNVVTDPVFTDQVSIDERRIDLERSGWAYGWFLADRFRFGERLTLEAGLRWDRQTYSDDSQWSPRLNIVAELGPRTTLRASWGHYWQAQGIEELQVIDGVDSFHPAQQNRQLTVALDQRFGERSRLSVQAYDKRLLDPRPRFENLFDSFDIFPEGQSDRVLVAPERGRSRGLELLFERRQRRLDWWASYALSKAEDRIDAAWVPRSWDQRHAVSYSVNLRPNRHWNLNLAGIHHSGWPATDALLVTDPGATFPRLVPGPRNSDNHPDYHRVDLRASRTFVTQRGEIKLFVEITNVFNRDNERSVSDFEINSTPDGFTIFREFETWFPRLPSFGASWTF